MIKRFLYINIYIYIYVCMYVCMYVLYINQSSKVFANVYTLKQVNSQIKLPFSVIMLWRSDLVQVDVLATTE